MKRHASFATLQISTPEEFMPDNILQTDVVGLGANAVDTVCVTPQFPQPNSKIPLSDVRIQFGGQVATAMITCTRLGLKARYIGSVGRDYWGQAQVASLRLEKNLEVQVREVEGGTSQFSVILLEEGVGERTILARRDPKMNYPPALLQRDMIVGGRALLLDNYDSEAGIQAATWAREAGMPVVIDIDAMQDDLTPELLRLVDYLIASSDLTEDPHELADRYGCPVVGITRGVEGAVFLDHGRLLESTAFKVPVVDTTGAGDVFHGAFVYGLLQNWTLEEIIRFSHAAAALSCMHIGARGGIPTLAGVQRFLKNHSSPLLGYLG
jgi:sulfofructose kinase